MNPKACGGCVLMWFSGFFGAGGLVHVLRLITGVSVQISGYEIPSSFSVFIIFLFGAMSISLMIAANNLCNCGCECGCRQRDKAGQGKGGV